MKNVVTILLYYSVPQSMCVLSQKLPVHGVMVLHMRNVDADSDYVAST
jgi:hypothetical protein